MPTSLDVGSMDIAQEPPLKVSEEGLQQTIEVASIADMVPDALQLAAFMEEEVEVYLPLPRGEKVEVPVTVTINNIRQHIFRNHPQMIRRKYVEVLARSTITEYEEDSDMDYVPGALPRSNTTQAYAFSVLRDSAKGISWLQELQRQARQ